MTNRVAVNSILLVEQGRITAVEPTASGCDDRGSIEVEKEAEMLFDGKEIEAAIYLLVFKPEPKLHHHYFCILKIIDDCLCK
jgi:hypothetical protein